MHFLFIVVFFGILSAVGYAENETAQSSASPLHKRGFQHYTPKSDHERELLRLVADKIHGLLNQPETGNSKLAAGEEPASKIESEARVIETIAHFMAGMTEQLEKRSHPDAVKKVESKSVPDTKLYGSIDLKKPANVAKAVEVNIEDPLKKDTSVDSVENPVLKLTPHVVFTDIDGREYRLVGSGGRSPQSCTGQCLRIDSESKNVLAFKKPSNVEHLVLMGHTGDEYFTSGVQLCDDVATKKSVNSHLPANVALLAPKQKIAHLQSEGVSMHWEEEKTSDVKRENPLMHKEFNNDVNKLFNGQGLRNVPQVKNAELVTPVNKPKKRNFRKRKHARVYSKRRRMVSKKRETRDADDGDYDYDDDEQGLVRSPQERTALELKLLEDLKKDKKNLEKFSKQEKSIIDTNKCKEHCEALSASLKKSVRTKRSVIEGDLRPLRNMKDFRVISITEPKEKKPKSDQSLLGEINMVQPESTAEEENGVVLKATNQPFDANLDVTFADKDEENLPDLVPSGVTDNNVFFPDLMNPDDAIMPDNLYQPDLMPVNIPNILSTIEPETDVEEFPSKPSSAAVGGQFAESILFRVQNSENLKKTLGTGLKYHPPEVVEDPVPQHSPHYSSTLQILLRTLMLNVEKIAEEDVQQRSCITLETELQDFLDEMLALESHPNLPSLYNANIGPVSSYAQLELRKNELLELLREYKKLPPKAQEHASGVKSFIETEINSVDTQMNGGHSKI